MAAHVTHMGVHDHGFNNCTWGRCGASSSRRYEPEGHGAPCASWP
ncbi:MAG: hypothetical protein U0599_14215 [Vicinamibacteria bacterium]